MERRAAIPPIAHPDLPPGSMEILLSGAGLEPIRLGNLLVDDTFGRALIGSVSRNPAFVLMCIPR